MQVETYQNIFEKIFSDEWNENWKELRIVPIIVFSNGYTVKNHPNLRNGAHSIDEGLIPTVYWTTFRCRYNPGDKNREKNGMKSTMYSGSLHFYF